MIPLSGCFLCSSMLSNSISQLGRAMITCCLIVDRHTDSGRSRAFPLLYQSYHFYASQGVYSLSGPVEVCRYLETFYCWIERWEICIPCRVVGSRPVHVYRLPDAGPIWAEPLSEFAFCLLPLKSSVFQGYSFDRTIEWWLYCEMLDCLPSPAP